MEPVILRDALLAGGSAVICFEISKPINVGAELCTISSGLFGIAVLGERGDIILESVANESAGSTLNVPSSVSTACLDTMGDTGTTNLGAINGN